MTEFIQIMRFRTDHPHGIGALCTAGMSFSNVEVLDI